MSVPGNLGVIVGIRGICGYKRLPFNDRLIDRTSTVDSRSSGATENPRLPLTLYPRLRDKGS
jgi:hypothetical protein